MTSRRNVGYSVLNAEEIDDVDVNVCNGIMQHGPRFANTPKSYEIIPWKSIALALFTLGLGFLLLFLACFILTGHMGGERIHAYGLMTLGILAFLVS